MVPSHERNARDAILRPLARFRTYLDGRACSRVKGAKSNSSSSRGPSRLPFGSSSVSDGGRPLGSSSFECERRKEREVGEGESGENS
jgi:hypothetical protein